MKIFFDASALVSLLNPESLFYDQAKKAWQDSGQRATSCHAIAETYRTLTTLKKPIRPEVAQSALEDLAGKIELVDGTSGLYLEAVKRMAKGKHTGAMIYDALHCVAAQKCKAEKILTRNKPHFDKFAGEIPVVALA